MKAKTNFGSILYLTDRIISAFNALTPDLDCSDISPSHPIYRYNWYSERLDHYVKRMILRDEHLSTIEEILLQKHNPWAYEFYIIAYKKYSPLIPEVKKCKLYHNITPPKNKYQYYSRIIDLISYY